jgi:hypothetical protein
MNSARIKIGLRNIPETPETVIAEDMYENCEHGKTRTRYLAPCMKNGAHLAYGFYFLCPSFMEDGRGGNFNSLGDILVHKN